MANILICDDEKDIVNALKIYLNNPDYELYEAFNGLEALKIIENNQIDLVLLDIMMPIEDGISTLNKIRSFSNIPVILLTAKSEASDIVLGLNVGADDYITKPFNPIEVCARVNSQLRRYFNMNDKKSEELIEIGTIQMDDKAKIVKVDGIEKSLTLREYEILRLLMLNPNTVYSPKELYSLIWKENPYGSENTVAVHIRHLREKIEINPNDPRYIKVVFGHGYKLEKER